MIHSYPWYIADWRGSEKRLSMTLEEKAVYRELLDHCWEHGSLPNDEKVLAKISTATASEFRRIWPKVKQAFSVTGDRLIHEKVEAKRPEVIRLAEQRREAGRKSAEARAERARQRSLNDSSNARSTSVQAELQPSSTITSSSSSSTPTPSSAVRSERATTPRSAARFIKPSIEEVRAFCAENKITNVDPEKFWHHYEASGWKRGKTPLTNWRSAVHTWKRNDFQNNAAQPLNLGWEEPD